MYVGTASAGVQATGRDPVRDGNPVSNARSRINEVTLHLNSAAGAVGAIADGLYGCETPREAAAPCPMRFGEFGLLHDSLDELLDALGRIERQVARLDALREDAGKRETITPRPAR